MIYHWIDSERYSSDSYLLLIDQLNRNFNLAAPYSNTLPLEGYLGHPDIYETLKYLLMVVNKKDQLVLYDGPTCCLNFCDFLTLIQTLHGHGIEIYIAKYCWHLPAEASFSRRLMLEMTRKMAADFPTQVMVDLPINTRH